MRGMILAAGRGERMGALTLEQPKPLIRLNGRFLIEYSINAFIKMGIREIVINLGYKGEQIKAALGTGAQFGVQIEYSEEKELLETGGGIFKALPLLGSEPFVVLSADVVTDFPLAQLPKTLSGLAHLVLVDNPNYHPTGDFTLINGQVYSVATELDASSSQKANHYFGEDLKSQPAENGHSQNQESVELFPSQSKTFSNIGVYHPALFADCKPGRFRLGDLLKRAVQNNQVSGEYYQGAWYNIGTAEELSIATREFRWGL